MGSPWQPWTSSTVGHCGNVVLALTPKMVGFRLAVARPNDAAVGIPALTLREILWRTGVSGFDLVSDIEGAESAFLLRTLMCYVNAGARS